MVEVYYNSTDGTWEWKLDGVSIGSGTDPDFVPDVIGQLWIWVGVGDGGTDRTAIYFDNILVDTHLPT
ncbi:MAG: hypothetical protein MUO95_02460 [Methanoregula sp.]|nr:hypothetical protein [Methanoregula sp.]